MAEIEDLIQRRKNTKTTKPKKTNVSLEPSTKRVFGYIRVSTGMQASEGISLETQRDKINKWCEIKGIEPSNLTIFEDAGISAKNVDRPALIEMFRKLEPNITIVVADLSRFCRSVQDGRDLLDIIYKKECGLVTLNPEIDFTTAMGKAMYNLMLTFAEIERDQISERVSVNMMTLSKKGELRSKAPFGWKFVGKDQDMVKNEREQEIIKYLLELYVQGESYNKIASLLNESGIKNDGKQFYAQTVKNILADHGYIHIQGRKPLSERYLKTNKPKKNLSDV